VNKTILLGRLTRDPDVRYTQGKEPMAVAKFAIAVDRKFKREGEPTTDFFNVTAFCGLGKFVEKYLKQGIKVVVSGRIQNDNYTNKNGEKVYSVQIIAEEIDFAESKKAADNQGAETTDGWQEIPEGIESSLPFK
jgi:single-strand DNA-binding protein